VLELPVAARLPNLDPSVGVQSLEHLARRHTQLDDNLSGLVPASMTFDERTSCPACPIVIRHLTPAELDQP
jgi:hypothetical protein